MNAPIKQKPDGSALPADPLLEKLLRVHRSHPNSLKALRKANRERQRNPRSVKLPETGPEIVKQLFAEMNRQKISQREVARRSGFDRCTMRSWRYRKGNPQLASIIAVAEVLGCEVVLKKRGAKA